MFGRIERHLFMTMNSSTVDKIIIIGIPLIVGLSFLYEISLADLEEWTKPLETLINITFWLTLAASIEILVLVSVALRVYAAKSDSKSWRYMAIIAFSLVGSVGVSIFTANENTNLPILIALAVSLCHFGYWAWKRELIETSTYQDKMETTTDKLAEILNIMPDKMAFKKMAEATKEIYEETNRLLILDENAETADHYKEIRSDAKEWLGKAILWMCEISSLWTVTHAKLFEGNIMVAVPSDKIKDIPNAKEAFERGKHFFPDITTLNNISESCERVLYILTDLAVNTDPSEEVSVSPLLLPVNIRSENHPGSIRGAPRAIERCYVDVVKNIGELIDDLPPNYVGRQRDEIKQYFNRQFKCGSIISIPIAYKDSEGIEVNAVINLYRPEEGIIKSPELYEYFTEPLVLLITQLLYLYQVRGIETENPERSKQNEVSSNG